MTTFHGLRVGVFDSGLGGLSMMTALHEQLPGASMTYVADSAHAPYGERSDAFILARCHAITRQLLEEGANVMVVACNTATAVAIHALREAWPNTPFIGVEPGIKPAIAQSTSKRVGVLATPMTLGSQKFKTLVETHAGEAQLILQPCPGLAGEIEKGLLDTTELHALVARFMTPLLDASVDTIVLGCTHYPLILPLFKAQGSSDMRWVDTSSAVSLHAKRIAEKLSCAVNEEAPVTPDSVAAALTLKTTGDPAQLQKVARLWLGQNALIAQRF